MARVRLWSGQEATRLGLSAGQPVGGWQPGWLRVRSSINSSAILAATIPSLCSAPPLSGLSVWYGPTVAGTVSRTSLHVSVLSQLAACCLTASPDGAGPCL